MNEASCNYPLISITTPTFNCETTIARTMDSVLIQEYKCIEYIVMDGCSTDATFEIVKSYKEKFEEAGILFSCYSEPDKGMYDAINKAMDLATGDILGNINGDDYYEPGAFEIVAKEYEEDPFDVLYGDLRVKTGDTVIIKHSKKMGAWESTRHWNHPTMFLANRAKPLRYRLDNPYADFDLLLRARRDGMVTRTVNQELATFEFGGMSTKKSMADVRKRIGWRFQIYNDNGCSPISYIEGAVMEFAKFVMA